MIIVCCIFDDFFFFACLFASCTVRGLQAPLATPPTGAANVIQRIPIMKHVFGLFGLVGASSRSLTSALRRTSVVLYVGGIAVSVLTPSSSVPARHMAGKKIVTEVRALL